MELFTIDWKEIFAVEMGVFELVLRGTLIYVGILVLLRILPRRTGGEFEMMDFLFIILIAEAATHALGDYSSITEGFIVIITLMTWNYVLNVLTYHSPFVERLMAAKPLPIIKNGKLIRKNMRREYITLAELMEHLREQGLEDYQDIKIAQVEGNGK